MSTRTVAITGSAAGIGRATALTFLRRGWAVGAYDVDEAGLRDLAAQATGLPGVLVAATLDVTDGEAFATRLAELVADRGRLDVLVNNAGIMVPGRFEDQDRARHTREIDINVVGVMNGLHAGFAHLRDTAAAQGTSTVVNLASASAIYGQAELANYSATKFYVRGITEALDLDWGVHGIRVTAMWPLFVQTAMVDSVQTGTTDSLGVNLSAQDVADAILQAVEPGTARRLLHQVHFPVGLPARALAAGARFSPAWLTRAVNKRLSHS